MKRSMNPAFVGPLSSHTHAKDKDGNKLSGFFEIECEEMSPAKFEKFKRANYAYLQSNEHVSQGPFANNFGSKLHEEK